jgi:hypothetical protein
MNSLWKSSDLVRVINSFVNDIYTIISLRSVNNTLHSYSYEVSCTDSQLDLVRSTDVIVKLICLYDEDNDEDDKYILPTLREFCMTSGRMIALSDYEYTNLQYLYVECNINNLTNLSFKYMPNLTYLDYSFGHHDVNCFISSEAFKYIPKLQYLRIAEMDEIQSTSQITDEIFDYLHNLIHLNCSRMSGITGYGNVPSTLVSLCIGCDNYGFRAGALMTGLYHNLKYLSTCHYVQLPRNLLYYLPNLIYLHTNAVLYKNKKLQFSRNEQIPNHRDQYRIQRDSRDILDRRINDHESDSESESTYDSESKSDYDSNSDLDESDLNNIVRNHNLCDASYITDTELIEYFGTGYSVMLGKELVINAHEFSDDCMSVKYDLNVRGINSMHPMIVSFNEPDCVGCTYHKLVKVGNELVTYDYDSIH